MSGRRSSRRTAPPVTISIWTQRSGEITTVPASHWETRDCVAGNPAAASILANLA